METRVYFAAGSAETAFGLITDVSVLADTLRQRRDPNLKIYFDILDGEVHEGVFPAAFMRGMVGLYAGQRRPSATRVSW